ncbi:MAG TPA: glycoside hydrolase family 43 protein [Microlunatus sp.]|nr:glycoside hydrolase family 43 protein [Microlunatus sp.]
MISTTRRQLLGGLILTGLAGTACGGIDDPVTTDQQGEPVGFTNPVVDTNVPDPMIIADDEGSWWAYATNGNGANVQTLRSTDLVTWEQLPDALPELPAWTTTGSTWAPEVSRAPDGRWLMYYTTPAPADRGNIQSIGLAVADAPGGPFVDGSDEPLVCETEDGGSIDAHPFTASDGERYLYWKNDGNRIGVDTWISVQRLDSSGTELVGEPQRLIQQDQPWEGSLVEAPFVVEADGTFWLFYSANAFDSDAYAVGVARGTSPTGPFTKQPEPILISDDVAAGPGHCAIFAVDGRRWMVYHAWPTDAVGSSIPGRTMWLSEVTVDATTVSVVPPTTDYQTRPLP